MGRSYTINMPTDELRPEDDLKSLRVRRVGPERSHFIGHPIQLEPDVAELFPDSEAVNEALRMLIRILRENEAALSAVSEKA